MTFLAAITARLAVTTTYLPPWLGITMIGSRLFMLARPPISGFPPRHSRHVGTSHQGACARGDCDALIANAEYCQSILRGHWVEVCVVDVGSVDHGTSVAISLPLVLEQFAPR